MQKQEKSTEKFVNKEKSNPLKKISKSQKKNKLKLKSNEHS